MAEVLVTSFPSGAKVELHKRYGDTFTPGGDPVATETADEDSRARFEDLPADVSYWAAQQLTNGRWHSVAVLSKDKTEKERLSEEQVRERLTQTRPPGHPSETRVSGTGARSTHDAQRVLEATREQTWQATGRRSAHSPTPEGQRESEPQPHIKQSDISDEVWQRSATPLGEATPKPLGEPQPKPAQDDERLPDDQLQRSDTEQGEATPIPEGEESDAVSPSRKQEDVEDEPQRSDTPTGEAVLKGEAGPRGSAKNPSSWEQARGERPVSAYAKDDEGRSTGGDQQAKADAKPAPKNGRRRRRRAPSEA